MEGLMFSVSRKARALTAAFAVVLALGVCAAGAGAAPVFGVVPQAQLTQEQFNKLEQGGVKTMRTGLAWSEVQSKSGAPYAWAGFDALVEKAAKANIEVLPYVISPPTWAVPLKSVPGSPGSKAPARLPVTGTAATAWSAFLKAA